MPPHTPNRNPHDLGRRGELLAQEHLAGKGWELMATNYRFGRREIDIVARRGRLVAFVEVKTRSGTAYGAPEEAVTRLKRREIEAVALEYLVRHRLTDVDVRFDVVSISPAASDGRLVCDHLEDAWRPGW